MISSKQTNNIKTLSDIKVELELSLTLPILQIYENYLLYGEKTMTGKIEKSKS